MNSDVKLVENRDNLQGMLVKVDLRPTDRGGAQGGILVSGTGGEIYGNDISQDSRYIAISQFTATEIN